MALNISEQRFHAVNWYFKQIIPATKAGMLVWGETGHRGKLRGSEA